jgi:hypothetical protein
MQEFLYQLDSLKVLSAVQTSGSYNIEAFED